MNCAKSKRIATVAILIGSSVFGIGCGSSSPPVAPIPGAGTPGSSSCVPINAAQIPFTGTQIYFGSSNITGGQIPPQFVYSLGPVAPPPGSQVTVGIGAAGGPYQGASSEGSISLNITNTAPTTPANPGYPPYNTGFNSKIVNVTGSVSMSPQTQNMIMSQFGGGTGTGYYNNGNTYTNPYTNPYNNPYNQPQITPQLQQMPCVSGLGLNLGHNNYAIYGAWVYIYLNNTSHGYRMYISGAGGNTGYYGMPW